MFGKDHSTPTKEEIVAGSALVTAFGPVSLDPSSNYFLGAVRITSGTAELNAAAEVLLWLLRQGEVASGRSANLIPERHPEHLLSLGDHVIIHPDASYVVGSLNGKFAVRENIMLASLVRHLVERVSRYFVLEAIWTRGHAGDEANELVDGLAKKGTKDAHSPMFAKSRNY